MKAFSAPPPGFSDFFNEEIYQENDKIIEILKNPDYYEYYHSFKIADPRLPKPLYKPPI